MANIAFILLDIPDLTGGGGAERFFADFFEHYRKQPHPENNLFFITDNPGPLEKAGYLNFKDGIILVKNHRHTRFTKIKWLNRILSRTLGNFLLGNQLRRILIANQIQLLHIPLYEKRDLPVYTAIDKMQQGKRPSLVVNIVDCRLPHLWYSREYKNCGSEHYGEFFRRIALDGVYSWYENFAPFALKEKIFAGNPLIRSIASRYAPGNDQTSVQQKEKRLVWASRMDKPKNPFIFVDAIEVLSKKNLHALNDWKIEMYGKGLLLEQVQQHIQKANLSSIILLKTSDKMQEVFSKSMIFVSTQMYENFPSLAIAEAMKHGNAIIAANIGQTGLFVRHKQNGLMFKDGDPASLSRCMEELISDHIQNTEKMGLESIRMMREVHNRKNFTLQTDDFWRSVLERC